ncbi:hypothetical protein D3C86_1947970 [compost metagenome]
MISMVEALTAFCMLMTWLRSADRNMPILRMNSVAMVGTMPGMVTNQIFCQRLAPSISAAS